MASQLVLYLAHIIPLTVLWLSVVLEWIPLLQYGPSCDCWKHFVYFAPVYAVGLLGVYAAGSVVYGVATFNDCAAARDELLGEIVEARKDLEKKKII